MTTSPDLLQVFFEKHKHQVRQYLCRLLPTVEAAEDVAQEVFRVLFAKWLDEDGQMHEPENFLFRLAHHRMCNWWRDHARTREELTDFMYPSRETAEAILDAGIEFADRVVSKVDLDQALQSLPLRQRQAVILRRYAGLSLEETAAVMCMSPSGVKKADAAGRKALRESPLLRDYTQMEVPE